MGYKDQVSLLSVSTWPPRVAGAVDKGAAQPGGAAPLPWKMPADLQPGVKTSASRESPETRQKPAAEAAVLTVVAGQGLFRAGASYPQKFPEICPVLGKTTQRALFWLL